MCDTNGASNSVYCGVCVREDALNNIQVIRRVDRDKSPLFARQRSGKFFQSIATTTDVLVPSAIGLIERVDDQIRSGREVAATEIGEELGRCIFDNVAVERHAATRIRVDV